MQIQNPQKQHPNISENAWISETAIIVGNLTIADDVFVAPNAVTRAAERFSSVVIGSGCNVQDNVVIHALSNSKVLISDNTSLAHGCIVHGPCLIGEGCFIGFRSSTVHGVEIQNGKVFPSGRTITEKADVKNLEDITKDLAKFKKSVIIANLELVVGYNNLTEET